MATLTILAKFDLSAVEENLKKVIRFNQNLEKKVKQMTSPNLMARNLELKIKNEVRGMLIATGVRDTIRIRELVNNFEVDIKRTFNNRELDGYFSQEVNVTHAFKRNPTDMWTWNGRNPKVPNVLFKTSKVPKLLIYNILNSGRKIGRRQYIRPVQAKSLWFYSPFAHGLVKAKKTPKTAEPGINMDYIAQVVSNEYFEHTRDLINKAVSEWRKNN